MVRATGGELRTADVTDPLGRPVAAAWGLCGDGRTAVVEMARASGLELLAPQERAPLRTTTYGTGLLIREALDAGVERIVVGIGGSATVDGGTGMAAALGVRFLDAAGRPVREGSGGRLADIRDVDVAGLDPRIAQTEILVASDVTNPLTGPDGAARTYAPQKGATLEQVEQLEAGLRSLAEVIRKRLGVDVEALPGAGAAGGLGAGLAAFLGASIRSGVRTVMEAVRLEERMAGSELAFTGEGRLDGQTAFGKTVAGVACVAARLGVPLVALAGSLAEGFEALYPHGVTAAFSIMDRPMDLDAARAGTAALLAQAAESVCRLWLSARGARHA